MSVRNLVPLCSQSQPPQEILKNWLVRQNARKALKKRTIIGQIIMLPDYILHALRTLDDCPEALVKSDRPVFVVTETYQVLFGGSVILTL